MGRTSAERLWLIGTAIAALVLVLVGYFFLIGPQRSETADVGDQLESAQLQTTTLQARINALTSKKTRMAAYRQALHQAQAALPAVDDATATPALLRSLQSMSNATTTTLSSVTVSSPQPPSDNAPAAAAAPSASPSATASSSASSTGSTATGAAASSPAADVYVITVTARVTGSTRQLEAFLTQLQDVQPRAVLVTAASLGDDASGPGGTGSTQLRLTMSAFVTPSSAAPAKSGAPTPAAGH